ncbi:J domain-containing protein [Hymenobacter sp. BT175]|uniref:J domain-containing protein n=1 Tax=Hymenobacter translucens TaxID=2886507 RepID=UPI001D0ED778|nr:J domain-containing protein [Hymenobacter translucens]MCC2546573.1 J domain-containing protein [Hymenobacter translucens]
MTLPPMPLPEFEEFDSRNAPAPQRGLSRPQAEPDASPARQAFRQAVQAVENLRDQLRELEAAQAEARRTYWKQVGPLAQTVVTARRALFEPLEAGLTMGLSRAEEKQVEELLLHNAWTLHRRFGEDVTDLLRRYAPTGPLPEPDHDAEPASEPAPAPEQPGRRKTKAERAQEKAEREARKDQLALLTDTKALYRQLARANHPDLERNPELARAKTERMQQITKAYQNNDLYTLLDLLGRHAPAQPADDDDVLVRYTRALTQQQNALKQQLNELKYGPDRPFAGTGKKHEAELRLTKRQLRQELDYLELVQRTLQTPEGLRQLLRELGQAGQEGI